MNWPNWPTFYEGVNGGRPWEDRFGTWASQSPGFNLDKIRIPVRIVAPNRVSLLEEWEWFAALTRLGKPVEMVAMRDGFHLLVKPWERVVSQQGNVDWFDFWLNGHEDSDPAKAEQYKRWRELRKLQSAQTSGQKPN